MTQNISDVSEGGFPSSRYNKRKSLLSYWYQLTALPAVGQDASFKQQEAVRRSQLASIILLIAVLLVTPGFSAAAQNPTLAATLVLVILVDLFAFILNRMGYTTAAGVMAVCAMEAGLIASIVFVASFDSSNLAMLDLLVQSECVAVSLLPAWSVFVVAFFNCLFVMLRLFVIPGVTPALAAQLHASTGQIVSIPIILQVIVALVSFLWVMSALRALERADRAEVIAALERREIERQQQDIEQKKMLDQGIQQILDAHVRVANGDLSARAPLTKENVLWRVAYSLNNLLQRLQRASMAEQQHDRALKETMYIIEELRRAKKEQRHPQLRMTGTYIDALIVEISNTDMPTDNSLRRTSF